MSYRRAGTALENLPDIARLRRIISSIFSTSESRSGAVAPTPVLFTSSVMRLLCPPTAIGPLERVSRLAEAGI